MSGTERVAWRLETLISQESHRSLVSQVTLLLQDDSRILLVCCLVRILPGRESRLLEVVDEENKARNVRQEAPEVNGSVGLRKWVRSFLFSWLFNNGESPWVS